MIGVLADSYLLHPLNGLGYQFWSGIGSDFQEILLPVTILTGVIWIRRFARQHLECHEETCRKLGLHHVEGTPFRTCWEHHPVLGQHDHKSVPHAVILRRHSERAP